MSLQSSRAAFLAALLMSAAATLSSPPAYAENATSEGAKALAQSLKPYLGQSAFDRGLIAVTPKGEAYELRFDLQRILDGFGLPKGVVEMDAFSCLVAPLPEGRWKVSFDSYPNFTIRGPSPLGDGDDMVSVSAGGRAFEGIYDPKLAAFLSGTDKIARIEEKIRGPHSDGDVSFMDIGMRLEGKGLPDGSVSGKFEGMAGHLKETLNLKEVAKPNSSPSAPINMRVDLGPITYQASFEAMRSKEILDIIPFFVAHQGKQELIAHQDELKDKILAAIPLFKSANFIAKIENLAIDAPFGHFGIESLVESIHQTGFVSQEATELAFTVHGLRLPQGLVPAWAQPFVPTHVDVDVKFEMKDLDKIAKAAVADLDLRQDQAFDPAQIAPLMAMAMGSETKLTLAPGHLSAPGLQLYYHGDMAFLPQPAGTLTLEAEGLDKALARLQDAAKSNAELQQAVLGLNVAKGLAKPGANGRSVWVIGYAGGAVSVNGQKFGAPVKP
ncbi:MAG: hypothetical protein JO216_14265 [Hyphomicrobiales bacterium]|nr:hypothetical protein [Hyphomicrobiales bacterium]